MHSTQLHRIALGISIFILAACTQTGVQPAPPTLGPSATATSASHPTATLTPTAVPTETPFYLSVTVWPSEPVAPILVYHQFKSSSSQSTINKVTYPDFRASLERLYQSGYVSVPLEQWLAGDLRLAEGKRPLIFSMDDLFYRNQIKLMPDGTPSPETGLGIAWQFYQEYPEFGFHWALFASLGDKPYGSDPYPEWEQKLTEVIIWCLEHNAKIYNHTYRHAQLSQTDGVGVKAELTWNDQYLRKLLRKAGREDLIAGLGNIFAIPYGKWPRSEDGQAAIVNYKNPEGLPIQATMDVDFITRPAFMQPPYTPGFNRWRVPRMVANLKAIDYLVENHEKIPAAQACLLGPLDESRIQQSDYIQEQIGNAIHERRCGPGVYATEHFVFQATETQVELIHTVKR